MSNQRAKRERTFAITILAALAAIAGILSLVDAARYMGWLPIASFGDMNFVLPQAQWFAAIMAAIVGVIFFVVASWLWNLNPSGWLFVVIITIFNLIFLFLAILGRTSFSDVMLQIGVNALALILALLPSTKKAFLPPLPTADEVKAAANRAGVNRDDIGAHGRAATGIAATAGSVAAADAAKSVTTATDKAIDTTSATAAGAVDAAADAGTDAGPELKSAAGDTAAAATAAADDANDAADTTGDAFTRTTEVSLESEASVTVGSMSLTEVEGIGPKISETLNAAGINTFAELAATPVEDLRRILADAGLRADPGTWSEQAQLAASGKWEELRALQNRLTGGRVV